MLEISAIDHINLNVKDLKKTIVFYQRLFGFEIKEEGVREGAPYAIIGSNKRAFLALYESQEFNLDGFVNHFGFHIENFEEIMPTLIEQKVEYLYGGPYAYEKSRSVYIIDPNGIEIELSEKFGGDL